MFNSGDEMATALTRLILVSLGGIWLLKVVALSTRRTPGFSGLMAFLFAWPGVIPDPFCVRRPAQPIDGPRFLGAWMRMLCGIAAMILLAMGAPLLPSDLLGLGGVSALLLVLHLGLIDLLPWLLRWAGWPAPLLFDRPWAARSLEEFWSRRWNLAFVEMNRRLLLRWLRGRCGRRLSRLAVFALSGMVHELAISFPAGGGWGLPFGYFILQAAMVEIEERFRIRSRLWAWFWVIAPLPWLFHEPFRRAVILPFYCRLHAIIGGHSPSWYLSYALYAAAAGHLMTLIAGLQIPSRLAWKQDLPRLTRFNQKIFYVYGFYIVLCIVSFAVMTWALHDDFLAGARAARCLAGFIAIFWTVRVLVDLVWYDHRDWPPGNALVAGHALVTTLFCSLATVYWCAALI